MLVVGQGAAAELQVVLVVVTVVGGNFRVVVIHAWTRGLHDVDVEVAVVVLQLPLPGLMKGDVVDVTITASRSQLFPMIEKIAKISSNLNEPIHLFQLSHSIKLIVDEGEYKAFVRSALTKINIEKEATKLSRLDIRLSQGVEKTPEFGLFLTELLYRHGITIRQTYISEETILILSRDDGPRAYEILRREMDRGRTTSA